MTRRLIHVVGAAIFDRARCLVARRGPGMSSALRWEFPGGKVEVGESPRDALVRELREELGVTVTTAAWLGVGEAPVPDGPGRVVRLDVYAAAILEGVPEPREHAELLWLGAEELHGLDWAAADIPIVPRVVDALRSHAHGVDSG